MSEGRRWVWLGAKYTASLAVLVVIYVWVGGFHVPRNADLPMVVVGAVVFSTGTLLHTHAWSIYLAPLGRGPGWTSLYRADQAAAFSSLVLPSPVPSLARPLLLRGHLETVPGLASTLVERINVLAVYGVLLAVVGAAVHLAAPSPGLGPVLVGGGAAFLAASVGLRRLVQRADGDLRGSWLGRALLRLGGLARSSVDLVERTVADVRTVLSSPGTDRAGVAVQFAAIGGVGGLAGLVLGRALGIPAEPWVLWTAPVAAYALSALPFLPRGLGAVEGAGVAILAAFGVGAAPAFTFFVLYRAVVVTVLTVVGGTALVITGVDLLHQAGDAWETGS